ncbi:TPA: ATP-binding protein [Pseudomonas aeruginosa]|uniref:AAA family ATPase n=1 Tax=Pseudomonas kuykendallii TaxID=1007099 RepID=A0A2W5ER67_9PSED|nr:ATP-binding protein [Pseudomonas kuykendallii]EIU3464067.1 ATP-binding protein [Pseudomonas aeruginosa]MBG4913574.1 ATP-binding protein [Pseudomonas aeruginosa]MBG4925253.1 ATP-binding protein [Pseudomonas aeruginosa]MBG5555924.1 ATP-binding protein [Pseudomonas aeruginosa]MBG5569895.1 ATP-binding protein [Pseudomonas aeruginosa]
MTTTLHPRYLQQQVLDALSDTPVVCILGPRQVGKTTLARQLEPGRTYVSFDDNTMLAAARYDPLGFVAGLPDRVILDEVQRVPELLPAIKLSVDNDRRPGRFILTGSANLLLLPNVQESLAGRMEVIYLNPLSEQEKHHSDFSLLEALLTNQIKPAITGVQPPVAGIAEAVVGGGYPEPNTRTEARARQWYRQYLNAIIQRDVQDIANIRDGDELLRLLQLIALRTGNLINISNLMQDIGLQRDTISRYLSVLERLFLVRTLPAWHRNAAKRLIKAPKIHIIDSGLGSSLTGLKAADWNKPDNAFGGMLESFVVQQLICQSGWCDSELRFSHYRDKDQLEVDLVIEQDDRLWGVEVKKSASIQGRDARGLARLAEQAGRSWQGGILLYTGTSTLPLAEIQNAFAVPMNQLWHKD